MKAYAFRFIDSNGVPTGHIGFAFAPKKRDLFWEIDKYGDPYSVEIQKMRGCSFCFNQGRDVDHDMPSEFEYSEAMMFLPDYEWKRPKWPTSVHL